MNFEETLSYLKKFKAYEDLNDFNYDDESFDLSRLRRFVKEAEIDFSGVKFIHIAGSKGKGTVAKLFSDYLSKMGYCTGLFMSPYMNDYRDYFVVDGEKISKKEFAKIFTQISYKTDLSEITRFELCTAAVLKYFIDKQVDYAVIEVGLGGKKDASNIIFPELGILTRVEKEHTDKLGNTYEEILSEKMGIYKGGHKIIISEQEREVKELIGQNPD
ncbi:hypothetical protein GF354_06070, partial [Candidatus Peregrinibacteria bacterium]|nr:hypothetical protein [Candidatus Peregrinibacteria bacterium]